MQGSRDLNSYEMMTSQQIGLEPNLRKPHVLHVVQGPRSSVAKAHCIWSSDCMRIARDKGLNTQCEGDGKGA